VALAPLASACAAGPVPSRELTLRHVVLYQNGVGYFERAGALRDERLRLRFREREIDDVLKTLIVVEQGAGGGKKPSTVTALLPQKSPKLSEDPDETTWLDVVLSPRPTAELSIAYAVPTAAWKSAYRVVLPDQAAREKGALLQAWALIDNVSEEDWTGINLTLATGAPLTFSTNLRAPRFVKRPAAAGQEGESAATGPVLAERTAAPDRDGDGIPDAEDACPNEPGAPNVAPKQNGCPQATRVMVSHNEIRILQQVRFARDSDQIPAEGRPILDAVVTVLREHPDIRAMTIEGHASRGEKDPWGLAARRGGAVRAYLIARGVTTDLTVSAFGDTRPIADNSAEAGRVLNRRVEFRRVEGPPAPASPGAVSARRVEQTARASAISRDVSGMIRYDITHPVTIPRLSSTMVTIINEYVPGEDIFLFRPDAAVHGSDRYPLRAARIENRSNFGLQAGPVAIFGGGTFVGEGLIEKLDPGETAFIPYGVDSSTSVEVETLSDQSPARLVSVARGVMTVEDDFKATTRYRVTVGAQAPARLFLRHARKAGYEAAPLPPDTSTSSEAYLIPIPITPRKSSVLAVEERQVRRAELPILATEGPRLAAYLKGSALPPDVGKRLREIVTLRSEAGRLEREMEALRAQLGDLGQRSYELRESLRSIEKTPRAAALQQKLLDRLAEAAKQSDEASQKLAADNMALSEARAQLAESLRDLRVEPPAPRAGP
jgi:outer membrane protein OmpA-like peptidoglycan-associated protein